jgi:HPt (histidine-containing phosphotransfer) domain-containing protein
LFLGNAALGIDAIHRALDADDTVAAADAAHRLKSASGFLGASRLASLCAEIEAGAASEDVEEALTVELRRTAADLEVLVGRIARSGTPSA